MLSVSVSGELEGDRDNKAYLSKRLLLAVRRICGLVGLMLTHPIFWSDKPYHLAFDLS